MPDPFATALEAQYRAPGSVAAEFVRAAGGPVVPLRVLRYEREAGALIGPGNVNRALRYEIRLADLVSAPLIGDSIVEARGTFRITEVTVIGDVADGVWLCGVRGPAA